jgi:hypothetical membrane protein
MPSNSAGKRNNGSVGKKMTPDDERCFSVHGRGRDDLIGITRRAACPNAILAEMPSPNASSRIGLALSTAPSGRRSTGAAFRIVCAAAVAMPGFGYVMAGVFPETSPVHWIVGATSVYLGSIVGFLLAGLLLRADPGWRRWGTYSLIASAATLALVALTFYAFQPNTPRAGGGLGGLMERVLFIEIFTWYVAFGWRLYRDRAISRPQAEFRY